METRLFMDVEFKEWVSNTCTIRGGLKADECYFCGMPVAEKLTGTGLEILTEEEGDPDVYRCNHCEEWYGVITDADGNFVSYADSGYM